MTQSLAQVNGTLLSVSKNAGSENYIVNAATPTRVWHGSVDAYVCRKIMSQFNADGTELNRLANVEIILPGDLEPATSIEAGDTLEFQQWDNVRGEYKVYKGRAQSFSTPANLPGLPNEFKVALEKVQAVV